MKFNCCRQAQPGLASLHILALVFITIFASHCNSFAVSYKRDTHVRACEFKSLGTHKRQGSVVGRLTFCYQRLQAVQPEDMEYLPVDQVAEALEDILKTSIEEGDIIPQHDHPMNIATINSGFDNTLRTRDTDFQVREEGECQKVSFNFFEEAFNYLANKGYVRMKDDEGSEWMEAVNAAHESLPNGTRYETGTCLMVLSKPVDLTLLLRDRSNSGNGSGHGIVYIAVEKNGNGDVEENGFDATKQTESDETQTLVRQVVSAIKVFQLMILLYLVYTIAMAFLRWTGNIFDI